MVETAFTLLSIGLMEQFEKQVSDPCGQQSWPHLENDLGGVRTAVLQGKRPALGFCSSSWWASGLGGFSPTPSSHNSLPTRQEGSWTCGCSAADGLQGGAATACSSDGAATPVWVLVFDFMFYSGQLLDHLLVALHEHQLPGTVWRLQVEGEHHLSQERKECGFWCCFWWACWSGGESTDLRSCQSSASGPKTAALWGWKSVGCAESRSNVEITHKSQHESQQSPSRI